MKSLAALVTSFCAVLVLAANAHSQQNDPVEEIDLNIVYEQINEEDFRRSSAISVGDEDVRVAVGAAVEARRIRLTLRNVTGKVRFRASPDSLQRILERRRRADQ